MSATVIIETDPRLVGGPACWRCDGAGCGECEGCRYEIEQCGSCGVRGRQYATWLDGTRVGECCLLPELEPGDVPMPLEPLPCECCREVFPAGELVQVLGDRWCLTCGLVASNAALIIRDQVRSVSRVA